MIQTIFGIQVSFFSGNHPKTQVGNKSGFRKEGWLKRMGNQPLESWSLMTPLQNVRNFLSVQWKVRPVSTKQFMFEDLIKWKWGCICSPPRQVGRYRPAIILGIQNQPQLLGNSPNSSIQSLIWVRFFFIKSMFGWDSFEGSATGKNPTPAHPVAIVATSRFSRMAGSHDPGCWE